MPRNRLPRRRSPLLPWIIGLIVFALLAWGITVLLDGDQLEDDPIPVPRSQLDERSGASLAWRPGGTEVF